MSHRFRLCLILSLVAINPAIGDVRAADDPSDRWLHAFVLLQTGKQLGERDLWPLALANYVTALEYFERLATEHPDFQPEIVNFRVKNLKESIAEAQESMNAGDHDIAMLYVDFIETSGKGQDLRYSLRYEESYPYLVRARYQIDDLIERRPDELGPALAKQREYLVSLVDVTQDELLRQAEGAKLLNEIEKKFFLANAITLLELPEDPDVALSAALFPETLLPLGNPR